MELIADLHVHSRFSRATSRDLDFLALHRATLEKGIGLVGTGDFTHPGWRAEIDAQLEPAEDGLFRLRPDLRSRACAGLPAATAGDVRFALQVEISCIYKKDGRTRKNHDLVFMPSLDAATRFAERLAAIGNIASDGRPILGLDARDLLETVLETDPLAFLVPAHVWTPWFSLFGSKSGFDTVEECFGDLAGHIFALETGLSSDPPMCWRLSALDRFTLVSHSDAHSAEKLGREADLLDIEPSFAALRRALETREGWRGTLEFFPEEGKYHLDGHRRCDLRLEPGQTRALAEPRCPTCGEPLTVGVLSRVEDLADRPAGARPEGAPAFEHLVPLDEVVGECLGIGPATGGVARVLQELRSRLGPDLHVLRQVPLEDVARVGGPVLAEALRRTRAGEVHVAGGYDGEYGTVRIFAPGEREAIAGQGALVARPPRRASRREAAREAASPGAAPARRKREGSGGGADPGGPALVLVPDDDPLAGLDLAQRAAAEALHGPLLVVAGPGAGKTRTVVARMALLARRAGVDPRRMLAIAFTRQAAEELQDRVLRLVPGAVPGAPRVATFHALGLSLLQERAGRELHVLTDEERVDLLWSTARGPRRPVEVALEAIGLAKQSTDPRAVLAGTPHLRDLDRYEAERVARGVLDVDDLVLEAWRALAADPVLAAEVASRWDAVSVDEYQDVNDVQAALVALLCPGGRTLCAIGDPDQAIYGFRGARPGHFSRFAEAFPGTRRVELATSYRLGSRVLDAARAMLGKPGGMLALREGPPVEVVRCPTARSEAEQVLVRIERLLGGSSLFAVDSGRGGEGGDDDLGFGDVAVLCRLKAQRREIRTALERSSIPCHEVGEDEPHDPRSQKVALLTMHAAKGREFAVVFVTGVEEGLVPLRLEGLDADPEEERRLLYVAVTRARRLAVVSYAVKRTIFGRDLPGVPSRFIADLPPGSAVWTAPALSRAEGVQLRLF